MMVNNTARQRYEGIKGESECGNKGTELDQTEDQEALWCEQRR